MDLLKSALGGGKQNDLLSIVMSLIGGQKGGLNDLISQFTSNGLGDIIGSWVGTGENQAISPDQIQKALGSDQIKTIASQLGIDQNAVLSQLTNLLPQAIDKLTPDGKVPEGDILSQGMNLLGGLFGSK